MKRSFFQTAVVSILLYGCTAWTLIKRLEKKLDGNYTRMLRATLNKSWWQHLTRHQLYSHLPPITKTIQVRRTRHAGHCWRSRDELISDGLLWTPTYGRAKAGRPARTYIQQLCEDTGCSPEDLSEAMNDREKWRERVRYIRACGTTWWWWWWWWSSFWCSFRVLISMQPCYLQCWWILFLLIFLTHTVFLCHFRDIRPYALVFSSLLLLLLLFTPLEFFTSVLTDGFSLEFEWLQVSSSLQDPSQDSGRSQQCCHLDSLYPSANFQVLQAFQIIL